MRNPLLIPLVLITALSAGCATMDQTDCLNADWLAIGREDGRKGMAREHYQKRQEACSKHNISADRDAWLEGYEQGLEDFCTPANGYEKGRHGYHYQGICPAYLEGSFLLGYQQGQTLFNAEQQVSQYDDAIRERQQRIQDINYQIYQYEMALKKGDNSDLERQQIIARLRYLERDRYYLYRQLDDLRYQKDDAVRNLMQLEQNTLRAW